MLPSAARDHYVRQQRLNVATLLAARRVWARLGLGDWDAAWRALGPILVLLLTAAQRRAATESVLYVDEVVTEQGLDATTVAPVVTTRFAGTASDGRGLDSLLYEPVIAAKTAAKNGLDVREALAVGQRALDLITATEVADAGRAAESVAVTATPAVNGYVRMLTLPSCARCIILAGRWYRWSDGFERHPKCDCRHIPARENVAGDVTTDPRAAFDSLTTQQQDQAFTKAGAAAIRDGADMAQIVNARRGMTSVGARWTTEGANVNRGRYGRAMAAATGQLDPTQRAANGRYPKSDVFEQTDVKRLTPQAIYEMAAGDRDTALTLLARYGYLRP